MVSVNHTAPCHTCGRKVPPRPPLSSLPLGDKRHPHPSCDCTTHHSFEVPSDVACHHTGQIFTPSNALCSGRRQWHLALWFPSNRIICMYLRGAHCTTCAVSSEGGEGGGDSACVSLIPETYPLPIFAPLVEPHRWKAYAAERSNGRLDRHSGRTQGCCLGCHHQQGCNVMCHRSS